MAGMKNDIAIAPNWLPVWRTEKSRGRRCSGTTRESRCALAGVSGPTAQPRITAARTSVQTVPRMATPRDAAARTRDTWLTRTPPKRAAALPPITDVQIDMPKTVAVNRPTRLGSMPSSAAIAGAAIGIANSADTTSTCVKVMANTARNVPGPGRDAVKSASFTCVGGAGEGKMLEPMVDSTRAAFAEGAGQKNVIRGPDPRAHNRLSVETVCGCAGQARA